MIELPDGFNIEHVPATVLYSTDGKRAFVWHIGGVNHQNAVYTRQRLRRHGVKILNDPCNDSQALQPAAA